MFGESFTQYATCRFEYVSDKSVCSVPDHSSYTLHCSVGPFSFLSTNFSRGVTVNLCSVRPVVLYMFPDTFGAVHLAALYTDRVQRAYFRNTNTWKVTRPPLIGRINKSFPWFMSVVKDGVHESNVKNCNPIFLLSSDWFIWDRGHGAASRLSNQSLSSKT